MTELPPSTPIIVGVGVKNQKHSDPTLASTAIELMTSAVKAAAEDAGNNKLLEECDTILVTKGIWDYSDPGRLIAREVGAERTTTVLTDFGILQTTLLAEAAKRIANKEAEVVIVTGGEARYRHLMGQINGVELEDTVQENDVPDEFLQPQAEMWLDAESNAGLAMPVGFYAILEMAQMHASGRGIEEHRDYLGNLYSRFSEIAMDNPHAWNKGVMKAEEIRNPAGKNTMLAFPYTKKHNTSMNVDQSSALIFCSVEKAEALNIPRSQWVFPRAIVESNHMNAVSQSRDLSRSIGADVAAKRLLEAVGMSAAEVDFLDLYSCFPIAVQSYANALHVSPDQEYSYTGAMPFAGGPMNNYVFQSTCRLVELLRVNSDTKPESHGLISAVSGMLTKQGFGILSTLPPEAGTGFIFDDVTEQVAKENAPLEVLESFVGEATIASYTVLYEGGAPWRLVAICDTPNQQRVIAVNEDKDVMERAMAEDLCEKPVSVNGNQLSLS